MRLINFCRPGDTQAIRLGAHWKDRWIDVTAAAQTGLLRLPCDPPATIEDLLNTNTLRTLEIEFARTPDESLQRHTFHANDVVVKAPILRPRKLLGIGLNYRDHAEEFKIPIPKFPIVFGMYANAIVGPDEPIVIPPATSQVDYEAELGVVIGEKALRVSPERALDHVAGYTIVHDVSARDIQFGDKQWTRGKTIDTFAPIGPCLVTREELGDGSGLAIELRLNGQTLQRSNTSNLIFNVPALVSGISQTMTLEPGDVIATGTPSGVGYVRNPPIFMKPGDTVEIEIERIGILRNPVTAL